MSIGPQTDGQEAFKKLQECIANISGQPIEWFRQREFYLKSILNAFNTRYCSCITPHTGQPFDPIFLVVDGRIERVDSVYMEPLNLSENPLKVEFMVSLWHDNGTKKDMTHNAISILDALLYTKNGNVAGLYDTDITEFTLNTTSEIFKAKNSKGKSVVAKYSFERVNVPPYVRIVDNREVLKVEDTEYLRADDNTCLFDVLNVNVFIRPEIIPSSFVSGSASDKAVLDFEDSNYVSSKLDDKQRSLLVEFLFGPTNSNYFIDNIKEDTIKGTWSFTDQPVILDWDPLILDNIVLNVVNKDTPTTPEGKLISFLVNKSPLEMKFKLYGKKSDVGSSAKKVSTPSATPSKKKGAVFEPDEESDEEPDNVPIIQPTKNTTTTQQPMKIPQVTPLSQLHDIIVSVMKSPDQLKKDYWALSKLLNAFNYVYCSEISPDKGHEIKPLYLVYNNIDYRLAGVRIRDTKDIVYDLYDKNGKWTYVSFNDTNWSSALDTTTSTALFKQNKIDDTKLYSYQSGARPLYGMINRYYSATGIGRLSVTYDERWDENGLDVLLGVQSGVNNYWHIDTRYTPRLELDSASYGDKRGTSPLNDEQRSLLKSFLFPSSVALGGVLSGSVSWVTLYTMKSMYKWYQLLDVIRKKGSASLYATLVQDVAEIIYVSPSDPLELAIERLPKVKEEIDRVSKNQSNPLKDGTNFPLPKKDEDFNVLIGNVPRARLLYEELDKLQKRVVAMNNEIKTKEDEKKTLVAELDYVKGDLDLANVYYGKVFTYAFEQIAKTATEKRVITQVDITVMNTYIMSLQDADELARATLEAKKNEALTTKAIYSSNMDVMVGSEKFGKMIRDNVYKGKYSAEVLVMDDTLDSPVLHMNFENINTYTDENNKLVYGARSSSNSKQVYHTSNKNNMKPPKSGQMVVRIRDDQDRLMKERILSLPEISSNDQLCMLKAADVRFFLKRGDDAHQMKTLIVDV